MRTNRKFILVCILVAVLVSGFGIVRAQDTTNQGTINCDSDLMLNLYVAQRFFNYNAVVSQLQASGADTSSWVDTSQFNQGQFSNLSSSMTAMSGTTDASGAMVGTGILNNEQITGITTTLSQDAATLDQTFNAFAGVDPAAGNALSQSAVQGEDPQCTALRNQLYRFWQAVAIQDVGSGFTMGNNMGTGDMSGAGQAGTGDMGAEMTPEATASG